MRLTKATAIKGPFYLHTRTSEYLVALITSTRVRVCLRMPTCTGRAQTLGERHGRLER